MFAHGISSFTHMDEFMHLSMLLAPGWGGGGGYPQEINSESFPLGRVFDTGAAPGSVI